MDSTQTPVMASKISTIELRLADPVRHVDISDLKRFFGQPLHEAVLTHNRGPNDETAHKYPRVQFKAIEQFVYLIGIDSGSDLLEELWPQVDESELGGDDIVVLDSRLESSTTLIEATDTPVSYRFVTPWVALNQKNFREYTSSRSSAFRREKLSRTLVGNCLGMCESLAVSLHGRVDADCSGLTSIKTVSLGQPVIGFVGRFDLNMSLPDTIGLGKNVVSGFGTIQRSGAPRF